MTIIYDAIQATLETHLSTMTDAPSIAYNNFSFTPVDGEDFLKVSNLPTKRRPICRGSNPQHKYQGVFIVDCYTPEGIGTARANALSNAVIERFDTTTDIVHPTNSDVIVSVEYAERQEGIEDQPHYYVPVTIGYYTYY